MPATRTGMRSQRAARRIVESDTEDGTPVSSAPMSVESSIVEDAAIAQPQRNSRRTAHDAQLTPHARRKTRKANDVKPNFSAQEALQSTPTPVSSSQRTDSSQKVPYDHSSVIAPPVSGLTDENLTLVSPRHEESRRSATPAPLGDITAAANNTQHSDAAKEGTGSVTAIEDRHTAHAEKPMDIVIRSRMKMHVVPEEPAEPKPRLVITYLYLTNFKSYAGTQAVGPFHSSFSSVVGPNGSGKSNVIDSLLFVFGFRASKMRQGKLSSLIHNSAAFPNLDHCEVQVHFEEIMDLPTGQKEVIPDSALVVSRKAFKNNSSTYFVNGCSSNFTAVTTLLKDRGIDLDHKRFLILQGEVESIAQMKPKAGNEHEDGLLEYLEDIIGTSKYKTPIDEAVAQVEALNETCAEKNNRVQLVEKEKQSLEGRKNEAMEFVRLSNDLSIKQSMLFQVYVRDCNDNIEVMSEAINDIQNRAGEDARHHAAKVEALEALEADHKSRNKRFVKMQQSMQKRSHDVDAANRQLVSLEEKKKHAEGKRKKLEKAATSARVGISSCAETMQTLKQELVSQNDEMELIRRCLQSEEEHLDGIRSELQGKTQNLSDQIAQKQKLLEPTTKSINEKVSAIAVAESELEILESRGRDAQDALDQGKLKLQELAGERDCKLAEIEDCRRSIATHKKRIQQMQQKLLVLREEQPKLRLKVSQARAKAEEARSSFAKTQNQGNVLNSLSRLGESGRIRGFHGRLGNLGAIDKQYDVAVSTACPALDNLVVDSVDTAQQCIDHLRKNNLGRANFICLDRLGRRDLSMITTPEKAPRLFDLVTPKDAMFLPAFYSVMQDTLVATDLESANRMAFGARRWRVVTLDGQLIDKSGTMSGGGTRIARGAMSSEIAANVSRSSVEKLVELQEAEETSLRDLKAEEDSLNESIQKANDELPASEMRLQKIELEIQAAEKASSDIHSRQAELEKSAKTSAADQKTTDALGKTIAKHQKDIEMLRRDSQGLENEIQALQDQIMEAGGVRLRTQKAKVSSVREEIDSLAERISSAEVGISKAEKQLIKHEQTKLEAEAELESSNNAASQFDNDISEQRTRAVELTSQLEASATELENEKDELAELQNTLDTQRLEINELKAGELEMKRSLEETQKVLVENEKRLRYWGDKLSKLSLYSMSSLGEHDQEPELPTLSGDEMADADKELLNGEIAVLEEKLQNINVDLAVLDEYRQRVEEHAARSDDLHGALSTRDAAKSRCEELRRLRLEGFMQGFSAISLRLKEMYQMITMGGNAELELVDSLDPFSEGILFSVMPPKKSWKNISNLSGGEKTLSSLALVFALHHYKPTPLYVMDEIDAALDFRNVSIVASYIKTRTQNAQFIVISLRNNMFELASRLVGVYKVNQMTRSVTVENRDYITRA